MKMSRFIFSAMIVVALGMLGAAPSHGNTWDLVTDWTQTSPNVGGPGHFLADPNVINIWRVNVDDTDTPSAGFVDLTNNYFTPDGPDPDSDPDAHFFSGYASATRAAGKLYGTPGAGGGVLPIDPADQIALPPNRVGGGGVSGPVDIGDIFAIPGAAGGAVNIWWRAPRTMRIQTTLETYSVDTNAGNDIPVDFGIRSGPGLPLLLFPEFAGQANWGTPIPDYNPANGREFATMTIPEFTIPQGHHIMLRIIGNNPLQANNGVGISSFRIVEIPEPTTGLLCGLGGCLLMLRRKRS